MQKPLLPDSMDRISKLPSSIIHHIMSYLSAKEVAQTSILSKRWYHLRTSFPILDFHESCAYFIGKQYHYILGKKFRRRINEFVEFVDDSLLRFCKHGFSIWKFRLLLIVLDVNESSSLLDKWIELAVKHEVKELDFDVPSRDNVIIYTLPQMIFLAKSLTILKLGGCRMQRPSNTIRFRSLKSLTLKDVQTNEETLQKLTIECPLLEELFLFNCCGFRHIYFSKSTKLKIIYIDKPVHDTLQSVKLVLPSLTEFRIRFRQPESCTIDLAGCPNLKELRLARSNLTDQEFQSLVSNLPLLENLCISRSDFLNMVLISSTRLKILRVWGCPNLKKIDVDTPNLLLFDYSNSSIPIVSMNDPCPWEVTLENMNVVTDTLWFLKLKEFLGCSNQIKALNLYLWWDEDSLELIEFRNSLPSLPREVGNLLLRLIGGSLLSRAKWLDGFFGHYYSRNLIVEVVNKSDVEFIEMLHEEMRNRDSVRCCDSLHIKCWRHYLKDFKVAPFLKGFKNASVNIDDLVDALPVTVMFHLDWCFPKSLDKVLI